MFDIIKKIVGNKKKFRPFVSAIIVAAGNAKRMNKEVGKIFMEIEGYPLISYTLQAFEDSDCIDEVILVVKEDDIVLTMDVVAEFEYTKVKRIIKGGKERSDSVLNGINEMNSKTEIVAVHDGARPFVMPEDIDNVVTEAIKNKAAALGVKVKDTIKIVDENMFVVETPERENLWAVSTPQVFSKDLLLKAYKIYKDKNPEGRKKTTDDSMLVEELGYKIKMVEGNYDNIKITTPEDIYIAESILRYREMEGD